MPRGLVTRFLVTFFGRWRVVKNKTKAFDGQALGKPFIEPQEMALSDNGQIYATGFKSNIRGNRSFKQNISLSYTD